MNLKEFFQGCSKAALGFSGGVDSAYLLYAGVDAGADVRPYFVKTAFQPRFELEDARRLCDQLGVELTVVELDVLALPRVRGESGGPVLPLQADAVRGVEGAGAARRLFRAVGRHQRL